MTASLRIQRLHARIESGAQPVAARLALHSLGAELADVLPTALAPQALLMLRRVHLTLPAAALRQWPDAALRQQLRDAGRRHLDDAAAQARRPALEWVGDEAAAVLFADEAELLACLARDALRGGGERLAHWWWRDLLQGTWPDWRTAFTQRPQAVPAALRLLVRVDADLAVSLGLALGGAAVAQAPALPGQGPAPHSVPQAAVVRAPKPRPQRGPILVTPATANRPLADEMAWPGTARVHDRAEPDPLQRFAALPQGPPVAERGPALPQAAPVQSAAAVRGGGDAARPVDAAALPHALRPHALPPHTLPASASLAAVAAPGPAAANATEPLAGRQRAGRTAAQATMAPQPAATPATAPGLPPVTIQAQRAGPPASSAKPRSAKRLTPRRAARPPPDASALAQPESPPEPVPGPVPEIAPETAPDWPLPQALTSPQARLLLLVGALQDDGLYPDFTRPRDAGFPLPIWHLLAALGVRWLGAAALRGDPLWQALRTRSGAIPQPKPAQLAEWWPLAGGAPARASLAAWLRGYSMALRQRLLARLAVDDAGFTAALTAQPGERPALVWLSEADIVAEFDLNHHPLAWRLAGLDRDPGFLPSAGVSLRYRFT